ncbi:MAG: AAA domain-containing protein, partial [Akkermansiaceae bacterium]|nr:AAA domain-containing protein [Akkermansiaceae bacterium]
QVAASLTRPDHSRSVLLTGKQGVGKSALAMLVARRLQDEGFLIFRAASTDLQAGQCYIGQLEERVREFVEILRNHKILWIAESFHEFGLAGRHKFSQSSILDMVLPHLQSGAVRILGEIRPAALDRLAQEVPRLDTAMEIMRVTELPPAETLDLAAAWINHHPGRNGRKPVSTEDALAEGLRLCSQYLSSHYRPGKLLDLLKMTFSSLAEQHPVNGEVRLHPRAFVAALATLSGMPLEIIDDSRQLDLDGLRVLFDRSVMGQPEAVEALVERVAMLKSGLTDPTRPLGVFLFAGPTGTGKTEIAKTLAEFLFGSPERMIRLDMSEFQNPSSVSRIIGGPEESQSLSSRIRQQPFSVILLDEFEKAHPHVWDLFLQVFDDGRLTDQQGNTADLRHAIIILTSNLGAASAQGTPLGFSQERGPGYQPDEIHKSIEKTFRKEFVNRLDRIVCFRPLSRETMREILTKQLAQVLERRGLRNRPWHIEWDHSASEFLLERGFSPTMGARPLQRAVERYLLAPLAEAIVRGELGDDEQLLFIYARDGRLRWDSSLDPVADTGERDTEVEVQPLSNRKLILHPSGTEEELRSLIRRQEDLARLLELDAYRDRKQDCLDAMSAPGFWQNPGRFATLGLAEYIERIESSLLSTGEFLRRLLADPAHRGSAERFRSIISHHAERLFLLESAYHEITGRDRWDVFLAILPGDQSAASAAFAEKLGNMYEAWARQRGMRFTPLRLDLAANPPPVWAAAIEGFGAWCILGREAGKHIHSEGGRGDTASAEVRAVTQPPEPPDFLGLTVTTLAQREFAHNQPSPQTVRRYQEVPTPLVRDKISNWRTGRLDLVLRGHFDIIGS